MVAFGLVIGVAFPFFVMMLGVDGDTALTPMFFAACLGAGVLSGAINYSLARGVVGIRLRLLADSMSHVADTLKAVNISGDMSQCTPEECSIVVDSDDEIGESAKAFNRLVKALSHSMETQAAVRSFSEMLTSNLELETLAEKAMGQFIEYSGASGGAVLYEFGGELKVATSHGLKDPEAVAGSDHVLAAVRTGESQIVKIPDGIQVEGVLADDALYRAKDSGRNRIEIAK